MKFWFSILLSLSLLTGCSLIPSKVEYFQDKVAKFPEPKASEKETQRQAAALAALRANETVLAAVSNNVPASVISPARDTARLTDSVSESLGPPANPWGYDVESLAVRLDSSVAALNRRLDSFKADNNVNAGKKIEGTGFFQIGYFTQWGIILGLGALVWGGLKIWGMVNPAVGIGTNLVGRVSSTVLKRGFTEVIEGGEKFKKYLAESDLDEQVKATVKDLLWQAQVENQSRDVQSVIRDLTKES